MKASDPALDMIESSLALMPEDEARAWRAEYEALGRVWIALASLPDDGSRQRVLVWAISKYGTIAPEKVRR